MGKKPLPEIERCVCGRSAGVMMFFGKYVVACNLGTKTACWHGEGKNSKHDAIVVWNGVMKAAKEAKKECEE